MLKKITPLKPLEKVVSWVLQLGIISVLGYAAYLKLSDHSAEVALFSALGMEPAGRYIIGFLEALACVLLLIPQAAVHGAILTFGIMIGALLAHCTKIGFIGFTPIAAVSLMILSVVIIYIRRRQIRSISRMID